MLSQLHGATSQFPFMGTSLDIGLVLFCHYQVNLAGDLPTVECMQTTPPATFACQNHSRLLLCVLQTNSLNRGRWRCQGAMGLLKMLLLGCLPARCACSAE